MPVRLTEDGHAEAGGLQGAGQDRRREAGVIDVGVAADEDDVHGVPAAGAHFGTGGRRERSGVALVPEWQGKSGRRERGHGRVFQVRSMGKRKIWIVGWQFNQEETLFTL